MHHLFRGLFFVQIEFGSKSMISQSSPMYENPNLITQKSFHGIFHHALPYKRHYLPLYSVLILCITGKTVFQHLFFIFYPLGNDRDVRKRYHK